MIPAVQIANLHRVAPEIVLCAVGILVMILDPFIGPARQRILGWVALTGTLLALGAVHIAARDTGPAYSNLIFADSSACLFTSS